MLPLHFAEMRRRGDGSQVATTRTAKSYLERGDGRTSQSKTSEAANRRELADSRLAFWNAVIDDPKGDLSNLPRHGGSDALSRRRSISPRSCKSLQMLGCYSPCSSPSASCGWHFT